MMDVVYVLGAIVTYWLICELGFRFDMWRENRPFREMWKKEKEAERYYAFKRRQKEERVT